MGQEPDSQLDQAFFQHVRSALNHLYDPDYLRHSALPEALGLPDRFDMPAHLQRILTGAIEKLDVASESALSDPERELYELLLYRYVQQFSQDEVADQFGVSVRQLRRKQNAAIYALAAQLWHEYCAPRVGAADAHARLPHQTEPTLSSGSEGSGELTWLRQTSAGESTAVAQALPTVLRLIQPLVDSLAGEIVHDGPWNVDLALHPVAFQQSLLLVLNIALAAAQDHTVHLTGRTAAATLILEASCLPVEPNWQPNTDDGERLRAIRRLLKGSGAALDVEAEPDRLRVSLHFPVSRRVTVLVIEDNAEIVAVMQRFTAGTRFVVEGIQDPSATFEAVDRLQPDMIIVDIMMPETDGLLLMSRLREHPRFAAIPIIVCSVLPQVELARALGAADYVQKPFDRQDLLAALNRQAQRLG